MKIGKTIKVVTSPKREIRKATKKEEQPIPVKMPEKVPEKVPAESFHFVGQVWLGVNWWHSLSKTGYLNSACS